MHLKGRLLLQCSTAPSRFAHVLLTPAQTQRRWLLVARIRSTDEVPELRSQSAQDAFISARACFLMTVCLLYVLLLELLNQDAHDIGQDCAGASQMSPPDDVSD